MKALPKLKMLYERRSLVITRPRFRQEQIPHLSIQALTNKS